MNQQNQKKTKPGPYLCKQQSKLNTVTITMSVVQ